MIVAENLTKVFPDGHAAARDVSFVVEPGRILALLGGNGAGKTTTVNMLLGFVEPTSGRALLNGVDVQEDPLRAKARVGYVSENVLLYGSLTAEQNLRFFARITGSPTDREHLGSVLRRVGLEHAVKRRVETFSKGMRQRLGIAIALVKRPSALVADEPTTGLDPVGARDLARLLRDLRDDGLAVLLVTHDLHRIEELADEVAIMQRGALTGPVRPGAPGSVERLYHESIAALEASA